MHDLINKVAVVTGGANGIGRGIVEALLDEGVRVVIADIEAPVLDQTVHDLKDRGEVSGVAHRRLRLRFGRVAREERSSTVTARAISCSTTRA